MIFDRNIRLEGYNDIELMRLLNPETVKDVILKTDN